MFSALQFTRSRSRSRQKSGGSETLINLHIRQIQSRDVFKENTLSTNKKIEKEKRKKTRCRSRKEVRLENKMKENTLTSKNSKETWSRPRNQPRKKASLKILLFLFTFSFLLFPPHESNVEQFYDLPLLSIFPFVTSEDILILHTCRIYTIQGVNEKVFLNSLQSIPENS